jgi:hypothetical protein
LENKTALLSDIADEKEYCNNLLQMVNDVSMRQKFSNAGQGICIKQIWLPKIGS